MKKHFLLLASVLVMGFSVANAQGGGGGGMQRQTPEERTKSTMEKLAPLKLSAEQITKTTAIFSDAYNTQQKAMEEMRASGSFDREAYQAKRKEWDAARDVELKAVFTAEQFKKWQEEVEPSLRPQRKPNQ